MTTVLIHHRVADYDTWKLEYDRVVAGPLGSTIRSYTMWRGQDDPNLVILAKTYDSREEALAAHNRPELVSVIVEAGVDLLSMRIDYSDEVASSAGRAN